MTALTRDAIERILGPTDDEVAAALVSTGANEQELLEAHTWLSADEAMADAHKPPLRGRAAEAAEVLGSFDALPDDPEPDDPVS